MSAFCDLKQPTEFLLESDPRFAVLPPISVTTEAGNSIFLICFIIERVT